METTKNDLSGGTVKLDIQAVEKSVTIAYGLCLNAMSQTINKIRNSVDSKETTHLEANYLKTYANQFAVIAETYDALKGLETRPELIIVNRETK